ncbi:RNHCP domain-containing protein [Vallitalea okinawensis]|uniref:RNHCP domain-containing protein n=1 Tax=Vallitalea okinawensis TaxID=2078660 RepID=UPI000CFD1730|nr:RNHCP domain-containing protein [Vallitalea okinawensis]
MGRQSENQGFVCKNCGVKVIQLSNGSYRNHCPYCLYSLHVDNKPGDRENSCKGLMKPIGVKNTSKKGVQIVHECMNCGIQKVNKIAEYDTQPDDLDAIIRLM